ncbi:MAG: isoleucine--tRNA ligase [Pedosphaera sp.]|nr:isoleucine--tRNA ligase [Pedosphaera sp.]
MDYKNTLNLPKTDFPMKADLVSREPLRLEKWQASRLYQRIQANRASAEKFVLHDGPPFANGDVHIGTALNKVLKDIIVKYQTLRGKNVPYVPGWDCHGLPIEFKVTQEMRKAGDMNADPVTIRKACEAYAHKYIDIQRTQFKRLGVLGDWENPYLTLDKRYEAAELRLFADIVEKGFVYRGKKPVYWSIPCRTALAEAEVEYKDHVSRSVFVKFPVVGHPNTFLLIWTTTPWTLPANLAVAYNSTFSYSLVHTNAESYILSTMLLSSVAEKCNWGGYEIIRSLDGDHLNQIEYHHPFIARQGRLLAGDSFVENTTGTGFVHIAPGHGLEDYGLGLQHHLPVYSPVDDDGRFTHTSDLPSEQQMPSEFLGKSILEKNGKSDANESVLHVLREKTMLVHEEDYLHSYPHCWRSKTPVIFRAMDQWFIKIDHHNFRLSALDEINRVNWIPDWGKTRIEAAVKSRPDWCISRQRTWGVPIPAFYDASGKAILDVTIVRNTARLVQMHGSHIWFEQSVAELWKAVKPTDWASAEPVAKSNDTLDVWIDSGSSSRAVLMQREELQRSTLYPQPSNSTWQADMYLEGSDQHRGWFQSSLLLSLAGNGTAPFKTVLTHGFMVDADREKISKSKQGQGGYEKPQTSDAYIKKYGADVVRLWVASQDFRNDIVVSEERVNKVGETYRLLRNTLRYQLSNLYDFQPENHANLDQELTGLDRWILGEFAELQAEVIAAYEACEFHVVYQKVSQFAAVELSAIYHDIVKDRLYTGSANSRRRRSTQTALHRMVIGLCQMLAPMLAFTTDEAWEFVPGQVVDSVHLIHWPTPSFVRSGAEQQTWKNLFSIRELALPELEKARQAKVIGKALEAKIALSGHSDADLMVTAVAHSDALRELLNVSQIEVRTFVSAEIQIHVAHADGKKCERCWHWETDIGSNPDHPTICNQCVAAVKEGFHGN